MQIIIPIPEKISLNAIYSGVHYHQRNAHKTMYRWSVASVRPRVYRGAFPVSAHYHFRLRGPLLDVSNYAYMIKLIEDALVASGVLPDDGPKYVGSITITGEKISKDEKDEVVVELSNPQRKLQKKIG